MPLVGLHVNGFWKRNFRTQGERLCLSALSQARAPFFYEKWGVSDSLEGRFDCASLHVVLLLRHLRGPLAQAVFDRFFSYTELTLREMGVSDLKVGKQVKKCATFFYGALKVYEDALEGKENLEEALTRNLYGNAPSPYVNEVAAYVRVCDQYLRGINPERSEDFVWPSVEEKASKKCHP